MRATNLGFRSPKEKTAEYINPVVTFDGRFLPFLHNNKTTTFSKSKRFVQYNIEARKTGEKAGPGSYNLTYTPGAEWRIKGTILYKKLHESIDTGDNGYFFIGNSMVYEPSFVLSKRKSLRVSSADTTNRDPLFKSILSTEEEKSSASSDNKNKINVKEEEKESNLNENNRRKTAIPKTRKNDRKMSYEFRNSPYLAKNIKKISIKKKNIAQKDQETIKLE